MNLVWHYTNGLVVGDILASGVIKLATAGVQQTEKAAAWFSTNPVWDETANRGNMKLKKNDYHLGDLRVKVSDRHGAGPSHTGTAKPPGTIMVNLQSDLEVSEFNPDEMDRIFGGRFRVGVVAEAAPHAWQSFKKLSGIDPAIAKAMEGIGNPHEWRASFQPVPRVRWRTVEKMEHGIWIAYADLGYGPAKELA